MMSSISQTWIATITGGGPETVNLGSPVIIVRTSEVRGQRELLEIAGVLVNSRRLSRHPWIGKDVAGISGETWPGPEGSVSLIILGWTRPQSISFMITVERELLGRDGAPWPENM